MFFDCGIWCAADVSSFSPSSEQTEKVVEVKIVRIGNAVVKVGVI